MLLVCAQAYIAPSFLNGTSPLAIANADIPEISDFSTVALTSGAQHFPRGQLDQDPTDYAFESLYYLQAWQEAASPGHFYD